MTPTARTLKRLRDNGYIAQVVEKYNSFSRKRIDLFGCIDVVAIHPAQKGVLGIQATTTGHMAARIKKSKAIPALRVWLQAGNQFEVVGWSKKGPRGKRKIWTFKVVGILLGDL